MADFLVLVVTLSMMVGPLILALHDRVRQAFLRAQPGVGAPGYRLFAIYGANACSHAGCGCIARARVSAGIDSGSGRHL